MEKIDFGLADYEEKLQFEKDNKDLFDNVDDDDILSTSERNIIGRLGSNVKYMNLKGGEQKYIYNPDYISYENELPDVHNQTSYGTCWCEAGTAMIEWWMWKRTGKRFQFTRNEIWDIAGDGKDSSYEKRKNNKYDAISGGWASYALNAAYRYNNSENLKRHYFTGKTKSENCQKFKEMVDSVYGSGNSFLHKLKCPPEDREKTLLLLNQYGCICWSCFWYGGGNGAHEILLCKADQTNCYIRNSWGKDKLCEFSWTGVKKYAYSWCNGMDVAFATPFKKMD